MAFAVDAALTPRGATIVHLPQSGSTSRKRVGDEADENGEKAKVPKKEKDEEFEMFVESSFNDESDGKLEYKFEWDFFPKKRETI